MCSLEALLLDDLGKRADESCEIESVPSSERGDQNVLRMQRACDRENETERSITSRRRRPNGHWCFLVKARASRAKASTARGKGKQGQQGQQGQGRHGRDKSKDSMECWNCGKRGHFSKDCWRKNDNKGKGKHKKFATDVHILDSKKPEEGNNEPEVEIGGFHHVFP